MPLIEELETRIAKGEQYLEDHPGSEKGKARYYKLLAEYVSIVSRQEREADIKAIWIDLPPHCRYQKAGSEIVHSCVRLVYGRPEGEADITRAELAALLATRKAVIAAKEEASV